MDGLVIRTAGCNPGLTCRPDCDLLRSLGRFRIPTAYPQSKEKVMNLIIQLIIGGIIGWLASIVMKTNAQMGMIANIIVGIVGAGIGGWLSVQLGIGGPPIMGWVMAVAGAAVLIAVLRAIGVFK
jgi:uncharacterized membrane protein YeaQ/YmgE (transglycosylase-associated protein family)